jgi:hypothetical protein
MHEGCRETSEVEQHPKCMEHAILLEKPFGNCFIKQLQWNNDILRIPRRHFNSSCRLAWSCTAIDQSNCVFHCNYYTRSYYRKENAASPQGMKGSISNLLNKELFIWYHFARTRYEAGWFRYIEISHIAWFIKTPHYFLEMDYTVNERLSKQQ